MMQPPDVLMKKARRNMIIGLIVATLAVNSIILLAGDVESKNYFGNLLRPILAAVATGLAIIVVSRQKAKGVFGRSYVALAAGLALYLIAELLWAYYAIGVGIEVPFPSLADAFWLAAYGPFGYGLFTLSRMYSYGKKNGKALIITGIAVAVFACYYVAQLVAVSDLSTTDGVVATIIGISYPILDCILIIPALLAVMSAGRGYLTSVPWIFVSWIFTAIADGIFGFTAVASIAGDVSIWNLFYNAAYASMAAGLLWHNKYMIFDKKLNLNPTTQVNG